MTRPSKLKVHRASSQTISSYSVRGDTHMTSTLRGVGVGVGGGGVGKDVMLSDVEGGGLASVLDIQPFFYEIKLNLRYEQTSC